MINAYVVDPITIVRSGGYDSWGEPLASANILTNGKIEYKTRMVRNLEGEEVVSSAMVYLHEINTVVLLARDLTHEDMLTFDGVKHAIIRVDKPKAFSNPHYEVYVA